MVSGKDVVEEGFPREVVLKQTLEEHACQVDEQRKSFREDEDGVEVGSQCPVAEAAAAEKPAEGVAARRPLERLRCSLPPLHFPSVARIWKVPLNSAGGS